MFVKCALAHGNLRACTAKVDVFDSNSSQWQTTYAGEEIEDAPTARGGATMNIIENDQGTWAIIVRKKTRARPGHAFKNLYLPLS